MPGCRNLACISLLRPSAIGYYCCFNISITREMRHWHDMTSIQKKQPKRYKWLARTNIMCWSYPVVSFKHIFQAWPSHLTRLPSALYLDVVRYLPMLDDLVRWVLSPLIWVLRDLSLSGNQLEVDPSKNFQKDDCNLVVQFNNNNNNRKCC